MFSNISYQGIYRKDTLEYPEDALREALINAVIHRSYMGAHTQLKNYPDKFNLWNAGGLQGGIRIEDLKREHTSKPRNEFLADVFFKAGMIEAWGRGTIKILNECEKTGLSEPEFREEFGGFSVTLHKGGTGEKAAEKLGDRLGEKLGDSLGESERKILSLIAGNKFLSISAMSSALGISTTAIENNLKKLKDKNILKRIGSAKGGHWEAVK